MIVGALNLLLALAIIFVVAWVICYILIVGALNLLLALAIIFGVAWVICYILVVQWAGLV